MSAQISKRMLKCSALYYSTAELNEDGFVIYEEPITLSSIYVTTTRGASETSRGKESNDVMMLYYDCYNSSPSNIVWKLGDKIVFDNYEYFINSITPCYADGCHHYEIGLV